MLATKEMLYSQSCTAIPKKDLPHLLRKQLRTDLCDDLDASIVIYRDDKLPNLSPLLIFDRMGI